MAERSPFWITGLSVPFGRFRRFGRFADHAALARFNMFDLGCLGMERVATKELVMSRVSTTVSLHGWELTKEFCLAFVAFDLKHGAAARYRRGAGPVSDFGRSAYRRCARA